MKLIIKLANGNNYSTEVYGVKNQRWQSIFTKCLESLGKAKPHFWEDLDRYEFSIYPESIMIYIVLIDKTTLGTEISWDTLLPESLLKEFSEKGWAIPDDLTPEQELEMEKVIVKKIWESYKA